MFKRNSNAQSDDVVGTSVNKNKQSSQTCQLATMSITFHDVLLSSLQSLFLNSRMRVTVHLIFVSLGSIVSAFEMQA